MRLTNYTDYALRVLIHVGCRPDELVTIKSISEAYGVSHHHLAKVVQRLGQTGYLEIKRGRGGGVTLARPGSEIGIGDVVRDFELDFALVECFNPEADDCVISPVCALRSILGDAQGSFMGALDRYTLDDVVGGAKAAKLRRRLTPRSSKR